MMSRLSAAASVRWSELRDRLAGEHGATAVEYALMVGLIALVVVAAVTVLGQSTSSQFQDFSDKAGW